ncbi:hypothetical protein [Candidatus Lokiarchaeum ossiferum]|uniref:hypothetical protein n=1 Tax=Candidatus Lokiarchaeum ossiferum TaxID=2951803 RepID=UPI00352ED669
MPIITHQDLIELAKIDVEVASDFGKIAKKIETIASAEKKMGELYQSYTKDLSNFVRKMKDKSKQMEVLAREENSGVDDADVKAYKQRVAEVTDQIKALEGYYDRTKDLALQKKGMVKRMEEYNKLVVNNAKIRKRIVEIGLRIEKEKNKMVAADSLSKTEDALKDTEREFERSKKEMEKKWEQLVEERAEVNAMWAALKDSIEDFE